MSKSGVTTHIIPIRSFVDPKDHWIQLFDNIRSGKEDIVAAIATDIDTLKIVTKRVISPPRWVFDFKGTKEQALNLCQEWNAEIESGRRQSPKGSHYIIGEPKEAEDQIGIYFVERRTKYDPTAT